MRMIDAWHRRTGPERFETYTRWTLYLLIGVVPLMALGVAGTSMTSPAGAGAYLGLVLAQTALAIAVIREGVTAFRDGGHVRRVPVVVFFALTAATAVVAFVGLPPATDMGWHGRGAAVFLALLLGVFAVTPVITGGVVAWLALGCALVAAVANLPAMDGSLVVPTAIVYGVIAIAIAPSFRISIWMLGVVWEQERTRGLHARLAVAEERLRFSRDLHDVVGRTLSAVALKSELAAGLVGRDQGEAAVAQMLEVRELANDSLREVRAVVAGYRQADLASELIGARSMLRSAGVRTRVIGEDTVLPQRVQSALAWVVREGATNVVRHSSASACTIDLSVVDDDGARLARLAITNDGVTATPAVGSGLTGLTERLAPLGGTITTRAGEGTFVLTATVPCVEDGSSGRTVVPRAVGAGEHELVSAAGSSRDPDASPAPPVGPADPVGPAEGGTMDRP